MHRFDLRRIVLYVVLIVLLIGQAAYASDLKDAKDERSEVEDQIKNTIQEKEIKEDTVAVKGNQIAEIDDEIVTGQIAMSVLEGDFYALIKEHESVREQAKAAEKDFEDKSSAAKEAILRIYKNSGNAYISYVNDSESSLEMLRKINYVSRIIESDKKKIYESLIAYQELCAKKEMVLILARQKNDEIRDMEDRIGTLETSRSGIEREISKTDEEIASLEQKTEDLQEYSGELKEKIKELQKNSTVYVGGEMLWPVPSSGEVVSYFGYRIHPIYHVKKMHKGIDIAASYYAEIAAANDGIVLSSCYMSGYGYTVIIDHGGGITTLYGHCKKLIAKTGDLVFKGDLIALVGSSGLSTGPHLHFEVRVDGVQKNPFNYLEQ